MPNPSLKRTPNGLARRPGWAGASPQFCPAWPSHQAVGRRLARTLGLTKHMNSGFLIVLLVATILVAAPSTFAGVWAWRRGGAFRAAAVVALIAILCLAGLLLVPSDWPNTYEEKIVIFLAAWGLMFALTAIPFSLFVLGKRIYQQLHRSSK